MVDVYRYPRDLRWLGLGPGVRIYPAGPGVEWIETLVTLVRQETGFGFRIVGGTEEGSQVGSMVRRELFSAVAVGGCCAVIGDGIVQCFLFALRLQMCVCKWVVDVKKLGNLKVHFRNGMLLYVVLKIIKKINCSYRNSK